MKNVIDVDQLIGPVEALKVVTLDDLENRVENKCIFYFSELKLEDEIGEHFSAEMAVGQ